MTLRFRTQRRIAKLLAIVVLAYSVMTPAAIANMWGMDHVNVSRSAPPVDDNPCHETATESPQPSEAETDPPCCEGGNCLCVVSPGLIAAAGSRLQAVPPHDPVLTGIEALHPRSLRESPLRPPNL